MIPSDLDLEASFIGEMQKTDKAKRGADFLNLVLGACRTKPIDDAVEGTGNGGVGED